MAGAALGWALSRLRDRATWHREDRLRWMTARRDAYADFLVAAGHYHVRASELVEEAVRHLAEERYAIRTPERERAAVDAAYVDLELVAPDPITFDALALTWAIEDLLKKDLTSELFRKLHEDRVAECRRRLVKSVRSDLGVKAGWKKKPWIIDVFWQLDIKRILLTRRLRSRLAVLAPRLRRWRS